MNRSGFSLVEILLALVVLEIGLLGIVGTLYLAARTLTRAEMIERGTASVERIYDSLAAVGSAPAEGRVLEGPGEIRWRVGTEGGLHVEFSVPGDSALVVVDGQVPRGVSP